MKLFRSVVAAFLVWAGVLTPALSWAEPSTAELVARLDELENQVKVLKRQLEVKKEDEDKKKAETAVVTASAKDGFSLKAPDDSFKLKIRGLLQTDSRNFFDNRKDLGTTDTWIVRRARPILEGTVQEKFGFYLMPDFGSSAAVLTDGYVEYLHAPEFKVRAGKFKEPFQLERLQSDAVANFIETGLTANLSPNRDVGAVVYGDLWNESLNYAVGAFNGTPDQGGATSADIDNNNDKDVAVRVFAHPFKNTDHELVKGLGVGVGLTHGHKEGASLPTFRSPGQVQVFTFNTNVTADGPHTRFSPQGYWYYRNFGVLAEYVVSNQELIRGAVSDKFKNKAWQVSANYVLTGEDTSFKGIKVRKPFNFELKQWGAFEIAARYGELDLDDAFFLQNFANPTLSVTKEQAGAVGLNWYLNNNLRLTLDYERTTFDGGGYDLADRPAEDVILTRFQLAF